MISHRYLSGLRIDHELQYRVRGSGSKSKPARWDTLHLQQAATDRACGLSCVLMLVMLFEGVPRDHAVSVASSARPRLKRLWSVAMAGYFRGTSPASLVRHLEAACEGREVSQLRGSHSELFVLAAEEIARDNVAAANRCQPKGAAALGHVGRRRMRRAGGDRQRVGHAKVRRLPRCLGWTRNLRR